MTAAESQFNAFYRHIDMPFFIDPSVFLGKLDTIQKDPIQKLCIRRKSPESFIRTKNLGSSVEYIVFRLLRIKVVELHGITLPQ